MAWEAPIAYTGAVTGYLLESSYYCEYKPLLDAKRTERIGPGRARELARKMLEALKRVPGKGRVFVKVTLVGDIDGVPAVVSPDAVYYEDGRPRAIVRARMRGRLRVYPGDWAPLILAAHILETTTNTGDITLAVAVGLDEPSLARALSNLKMHGPKPAKGGKWMVTTRIYNPVADLHELRDKIALLTGGRPPRVGGGGRRCRYCPYNGECPWSAGREV